MRDEPNKMGRQTLAIVTVDIPVQATPFDSDETIESILKEAVDKMTYPPEARVRAFLGFLPDPTTEMKVLTLQEGALPESQ